jgi:hypothetical protein
MWEGWTKNIYLGLRDHPAMLMLGAFGATIAVIAALFLPIWPVLGVLWYFKSGGWLAIGVIIQSLTVWGALLYARARVAKKMNISAWYAWTTPLGICSHDACLPWKVISGQGVMAGENIIQISNVVARCFPRHHLPLQPPKRSEWSGSGRRCA